MAEMQTDIALIEKVKEGNKVAFNILVSRYQNKIANSLRKYLALDDIPDIVQETFIKAYQQITFFRNESSFYTWLYRIAVNNAKNHLISNKNKQKSDVLVEEVEDFEDGDFVRNSETPENLLATSELKQKLFEVINNLPTELKMAIIYREIEGLDYEQIANIMSIPVGTVRSRLSRAREIIEQKIKNYL